MNKFVQFELWKDCKQGCKFCCNKGQPPVDKTVSCQYIMDVLKTLKPNEYDYIGLIGGELFNGEMELHMNSFFLILRKIRDLNPKKIFIATSLLYNIGDYLLPCLKAIDKVLGCLDKIVICTSWDKAYRFKSKEQQLLWCKNMLYLGNKYPQVDLHTEIILTQCFIDFVNAGVWDIDMFKQVFRTSVDFIEPASGLYYKDKYECQKDISGFFPTKASFIEFLKNMRDKIDLNTFLSMELRSDTLHYLCGNEHRVATNRRSTDGRVDMGDKSIKYDIGFIDSDESMRSVVEVFNEVYNNV